MVFPICFLESYVLPSSEACGGEGEGLRKGAPCAGHWDRNWTIGNDGSQGRSYSGHRLGGVDEERWDLGEIGVYQGVGRGESVGMEVYRVPPISLLPGSVPYKNECGYM